MEEADRAIELAYSLDQVGPVPALLARRDAAREALADLEARAIRARQQAAETPLERLQRRVDELEHQIQQQQARAKPNVQGLAALHRRLEEAEQRLAEALQAERRVPTTPEQLRAAVAEVVDAWPDDLLEQALRVYAARHKAEIEIVKADRRSRLGAEGWGPA